MARKPQAVRVEWMEHVFTRVDGVLYEHDHLIDPDTNTQAVRNGCGESAAWDAGYAAGRLDGVRLNAAARERLERIIEGGVPDVD